MTQGLIETRPESWHVYLPLLLQARVMLQWLFQAYGDDNCGEQSDLQAVTGQSVPSSSLLSARVPRGP